MGAAGARDRTDVAQLAAGRLAGHAVLCMEEEWNVEASNHH
jgi:hypothetical protein